MLKRRSSRWVLTSVRWSMLLSGGLPWLLLSVSPGAFIDAMEWQLGFAVLFGMYGSIGMLWAAMEKEAAVKYSIEAPWGNVIRAFMLLLILALVPSMAKIATGVADDITRQVSRQLAKGAKQPGFLSVLHLWPTIWTIICAYSMKPLWGGAVDSIRHKVVSPRMDLGPRRRIRKVVEEDSA